MAAQKHTIIKANNGKDREIITMCMQCLHDYEERRYEPPAKSKGVVRV
jgi:hypothetical protein